jgi:hypothetical protein
MYMSGFTLVTFKLEYESIVWNSITSTDTNKLECIQHKFGKLCFTCFFFLESVTVMFLP